MKGECALTCTKGHLIRSTGQMSELTLHTKHEIVINTYHLDRQTTDSPVAGHPSLWCLDTSKYAIYPIVSNIPLFICKICVHAIYMLYLSILRPSFRADNHGLMPTTIPWSQSSKKKYPPFILIGIHVIHGKKKLGYNLSQYAVWWIRILADSRMYLSNWKDNPSTTVMCCMKALKQVFSNHENRILYMQFLHDP